MNLPQISVIIPNYNGIKFINECISSLLYQTHIPSEIIFVDNGSIDNSVNFVKSNYPNVYVIELDKNYGFAKAVNEGIKKAKNELVFLLNNDTMVDKYCLEALAKASLNYPSYSFFATKLLFYQKRNVINAAGDGIYENGLGYNIGFQELDIGQYNLPKEVFGACAAAALYRKKLFDEIGLFDEDFFLVFEDVDINFRARLAGYKCLYIPDAVVYHFHLGSRGADTPISVYYMARNDMNVIVKNMPLSLLIKYLPKIFLRQQRLFLSMCFKKNVNAFIKGELAYLKKIISILKKRFMILHTRKIKVKELKKLFTK
jgi:GT2 family glycosyltransferase